MEVLVVKKIVWILLEFFNLLYWFFVVIEKMEKFWVGLVRMLKKVFFVVKVLFINKDCKVEIFFVFDCKLVEKILVFGLIC